MIRRFSFALVASAAVGLVACGGGSGSPGSPNGGGGNTSPLPGEAATITILPSGVSPKVVTVPLGSRVNFVNQSSSNDEVTSDPHPIHTDCPEINSVGFLSPGQSKMTANLNTARTCGYHDHNRSADTSLQGTITIQ